MENENNTLQISKIKDGRGTHSTQIKNINRIKIIQCINSSKEQITISQIAKKTGLTFTTVKRHIAQISDDTPNTEKDNKIKHSN